MANISQPLLLMTMLNRKPYQPFPCPCLPWILGNHLGFSSCNPPQSYLQRSFGWEYPYYWDIRLQSVLTFQEEAASCRTLIISLMGSSYHSVFQFKCFKKLSGTIGSRNLFKHILILEHLMDETPEFLIMTALTGFFVIHCCLPIHFHHCPRFYFLNLTRSRPY